MNRTKKHLWPRWMASAAVCALAGCAAASSAGSASASQETSQPTPAASSAGGASASQETSQPASAASQEAPESASAASSAASQPQSAAPSSVQGGTSASPQALEGTFAEQSAYTKEEYRPLLTLEPDGSANLRENLLEGMGNFTGRYSVADGTLTLTVDSVDFAESFACYNVREIVFTVQGENTLVLQTELCACVPGAVFVRA